MFFLSTTQPIILSQEKIEIKIKNMALSKTMGFLVLLLGLAIIIWSLYQVYGVYTQKITIPDFFKISESASLENKTAGGIEQQLQSAIKQQLSNFIPTNTISQSLNLGFFAVVIGLFIFGGSKIALIGVKLIKGKEDGDL
jgi:hypothetical protein